jgi:CSLREA domain-containing protein
MKSAMQHLLLLLVLMGLSLPASALEFVVNNTQDVPDEFPGNGSCTPVGGVGNTCTLRAAIMEANQHAGPHTIFLANGDYFLTLTGAGEDQATTGDLDIHQDITIINGTNTPPLIWGQFSDRVFDVHDGARLRLVNVQIAGGQANVDGTTRGGAIQVAGGAQLELDRVTISANIANIGGAIYSDGQVTIVDSLFFNNVITDDQVQTEFANGAAILSRGVLEIRGSTFRHNGVIPGGEGQFLSGRYAVHSRRGFVAEPETTVINSTFFDNTNGLFSDGVPTLVANATFVRNGQRGIRFLPDVDAGTQEQFVISHTVLYGHTGDCNGIPDDMPQFNVTNNRNASSDETCGFTGANDFENIAWPFLGDADFHGGPTETFMPRPGGILIDPTGSQCFITDGVDQRGLPRPVDGNGDLFPYCDIGAVEYQLGSDPVLEDGIFSDRFES